MVFTGLESQISIVSKIHRHLLQSETVSVRFEVFALIRPMPSATSNPSYRETKA